MKNIILILSLLFGGLTAKAGDQHGINLKPLQEAMIDKPYKVACLGCGICCAASCMTGCTSGVIFGSTVPTCLSWPVCGGSATAFCILDRCNRTPEPGEKFFSLAKPEPKPSATTRAWGYVSRSCNYIGSNIDSLPVVAAFKLAGAEDFRAEIKKNVQN